MIPAGMGRDEYIASQADRLVGCAGYSREEAAEQAGRIYDRAHALSPAQMLLRAEWLMGAGQ